MDVCALFRFVLFLTSTTNTQYEYGYGFNGENIFIAMDFENIYIIHISYIQYNTFISD